MNDILNPHQDHFSDDDKSQEASVRPQSFNDFAGQRQVLENLEIFVLAAKKRDKRICQITIDY